MSLSPGPFLLTLKEGQKRHSCNLDNLETDSGNISDGVTLPTESSDQNLIVFLLKFKGLNKQFAKLQHTLI